VEITSTPPGASVMQGNKEMGQTPLTLNDLRSGAVSYTLKLKGYNAATATCTITAKQQTALNATLEKSHGPQPGKNFTNRIGMELVWVDPLKCWVGKYDVTQAEYEKVTGENPSMFKGARRPVEMVTWEAAVAYTKKLTAREHNSDMLPEGYGYSLPTDAQYDTYVGDANLDDAVTSQDQTRSCTENVGSKGANNFGLYDTRGNLWQWCEDWYRADMYSSELRDKLSSLTNINDDGGGSKYKVMRGDWWYPGAPEILVSATRARDVPNGGRYSNHGLRVVLVVP
jgi:formylglycine-generating enzyme required for sulfatase activity